MRDNIISDPEYFSEYINFCKKTNSEWLNGFAALQDDKKAGSVFSVLLFAFSIIVKRYSRGDSINEIREDILNNIEYLKLRRKTLDAFPLPLSTEAMYEKLDLGTLFQDLTLFAFMIALKFSNDEIKDALKQIKNLKEDALLDLIVAFVSKRSPDEKIPSKYPKIYSKLVDVIHAAPEKRAEMVKIYLEQWYKLMSPIYWHDSHKAAEGAYDGYWAFDVALVVMLLDIDDTSFRDNKYYPKDLVAFYRNNKI
jgi:hypothetical protein